MSDTEKASWITDHAFVPPVHTDSKGDLICSWWERCSICKMAEAAHRDTMSSAFARTPERPAGVSGGRS